jgi:hypothetical protein
MTDGQEAILIRTARLQREIAAALEHVAPNDDAREFLAQLCARISLGHGVAMTTLAEVDALTSNIAMLRIQYEAVVRALWIYFAANDAYVDSLFDALPERFKKDPELPNIATMLAEITEHAPPAVGPMLQDLKTGAWRPMSSFVHTGIMPMKLALSDPRPDSAHDNLRNSNGLSLTAAMLIAYSSGDSNLTRRIRDLQLQFLDCQPPLREAPRDP